MWNFRIGFNRLMSKVKILKCEILSLYVRQTHILLCKKFMLKVIVVLFLILKTVHNVAFINSLFLSVLFTQSKFLEP